MQKQKSLKGSQTLKQHFSLRQVITEAETGEMGPDWKTETGEWEHLVAELEK